MAARSPPLRLTAEPGQADVLWAQLFSLSGEEIGFKLLDLDGSGYVIREEGFESLGLGGSSVHIPRHHPIFMFGFALRESDFLYVHC